MTPLLKTLGIPLELDNLHSAQYIPTHHPKHTALPPNSPPLLLK